MSISYSCFTFYMSTGEQAKGFYGCAAVANALLFVKEFVQHPQSRFYFCQVFNPYNRQIILISACGSCICLAVMSIGNHLRLHCNSLVTFSLCVLKSIKRNSTLNQKSRAKTGLIICLSAKQWGSHCVFMEVTVVHVCQTVLW